jgi:putative transposase
VVESKQYLLACSRYIELNPVRNGLVSKPADYRWSSYAHNALGMIDEMITAHKQYQQLGDDKSRVKAYRAMFKQKLSAEMVQQITDATLKGWVLGDSKFARKIEKLSGRRATQLPKGRPRGS